MNIEEAQIASTTDSSLMNTIVDWTFVKQKIEVLIFSSDEALSLHIIREALEDDRITDEVIVEKIHELNDEYTQSHRVFHIQQIAGGYRFLTDKRFSDTVQKLMQPKIQKKLSQSALETLAIITYKQPVSRTDIEDIRGTNVDYVIRLLLQKKLVNVVGRSEEIGKALLYGTTKEFLDYFNIENLSELPKLREIEEIMQEVDTDKLLQDELNQQLKAQKKKENNGDDNDNEFDSTE